jgi:hypothetical protein
MASLAFLIVYGTVSLGHLRVYHETGAKPWLLLLALSFVFEVAYRARTAHWRWSPQRPSGASSLPRSG